MRVDFWEQACGCVNLNKETALTEQGDCSYMNREGQRSHLVIHGWSKGGHLLF